MKPIKLPEKMLFGSATAATQIEGGDTNSNWYYWAKQGKIHNNSSTIIASDHYNRYHDDIALMNQLNHDVYRLSIEWSYFEPQEGVWSEEGIKHYQDEIKALLKAGIQPLVTLHHFSHPQWFEDKGGWCSNESVNYFKRYTAKVIDSLGEYVSEYCTINEPNVFVNDAYMDGNFPPGHKDDLSAYFTSSKNLILAHLEAYQLIHSMRKEMGYTDTMVGIALHIAYLDCNSKNPLTRLSKRLMDYSFHKLFLSGMVKGKLGFPIGSGYPIGKGTYCDFMGVNYYSRHLIHSSWNPAKLFGDVRVEDGLPNEKLNDMGWEIYPEGLYKVIRNVYEEYGLPIYITENGIPDATDSKRAKFIYDHMVQIERLISDGVDVRRYYHWSLIDNLEWHNGFWPRFGLIEIDYDTQERRIRKGGHFYGEICKNKAVTQEMINEYLID